MSCTYHVSLPINLIFSLITDKLKHDVSMKNEEKKRINKYRDFFFGSESLKHTDHYLGALPTCHSIFRGQKN